MESITTVIKKNKWVDNGKLAVGINCHGSNITNFLQEMTPDELFQFALDILDYLKSNYNEPKK